MTLEQFAQLPEDKKRRLLAEHQPHYLYRCYDAEGRLLYIGCSNDVEARIYTHRRANALATASWWISLCMDRYEVEGPYKTRSAGRAAEAAAIRAERPIFNTQGSGLSATQVRNEASLYLVAHGHRGVAIETACNCWADTLAAGGHDPFCAAHTCEDDGSWPALTKWLEETSLRFQSRGASRSRRAVA